MNTESWVYRVEIYPSESLGHFLGRFRRANKFTHKIMADQMDMDIRVEWVQAWEAPSRRCNPTELQQIALSKLVDISPKQLAKMLPPEPLHLRTRLCAACYAETPVHQTVWQSAEIESCDRHGLELISACPQCKTSFRIPALWEDACCEHCDLSFSQMKDFSAANNPTPQSD